MCRHRASIVNNLDAQATQDGKTTNFKLNAGLNNGARTSLRGSLQPTDKGYLLSLANADLTRGALAARLVQPAAINVAGSNVSFGDIVLDVGQGRVTVSGEVAETLNLAVAIQRLPLDIANTIKPDLGLGGEINGTAKVGGTRQRPDVNFDMQARAITAAALKKAGLDALNLDAKGTSTTDLLNVDAHLTGAGGLDASAKGSVPLAQGQLGVDFDLKSFPLTALNGVVKDQNLAGIISGRGRVTGTLQRPNAEFDLKGAGLSARPLQEAGLSPLQLAAAGRFANNTLTLSSAKVDGPQGFTVSASGNVPMSGSGLGINVTGNIPSVACQPLPCRSRDAGQRIHRSDRIGIRQLRAAADHAACSPPMARRSSIRKPISGCSASRCSAAWREPPSPSVRSMLRLSTGRHHQRNRDDFHRCGRQFPGQHRYQTGQGALCGWQSGGRNRDRRTCGQGSSDPRSCHLRQYQHRPGGNHRSGKLWRLFCGHRCQAQGSVKGR